MNDRRLLRLCCFALALAVIFAGSTAYYANHSTQYRRYIDSQYERVLSQLLNSVDQLEASLEKTRYLSAGALRQTMAADIWMESQLASAALSALPLGDQRPEQLETYLSQLGDYAYYLLRNNAYGKDTAGEWQALCALYGNAQQVRKELDTMKQLLDTGSLAWETLHAPASSDGGLNAQFLRVNDEFPEYPSLIYDGPYSDHVLQRTARALEGQATLTTEQAQVRAAKLLKMPAEQLRIDYQTDGQLPCYGFSGGTVSAAISRQGGFLLSFTDTRAIGEATLTAQQAVEKAQRFLSALDLPEMRASYHMEYEAILTINFHSFENGVLSYPDLIKVGIALDDGSVVRFDASGYAMNHHTRNTPQLSIDANTARQTLPTDLVVEHERLCYIPTTGYHEVLCWEFQCNSPEGRQILQYVNCETGQTENILLLTEGSNGTLTR
ncbi:MAG: germination protein YpeB [Clostridia bacterium]|nr:germination protein YpeB [Clostridia bacterium]